LRHHRVAIAAAAAFAATPAFAQSSSELELFAADAVLKAETTVASIRPATVRETPGVVTIVTREEIVRSGARDLIDVLRNVPGFSFGVDVEGVVDLGFRGVWGHEGKILLMIDGLEMNEQLFGGLFAEASWWSSPAVGTSVRRATTRAVMAASMAPAAPRVCPICALLLETGTRFTSSPSARASAAASIRSFSGVPVPWALT